MTMKEEITTTMAGNLADLITYYNKIQEEIKRLEYSKEIAKNTLLERFKTSKLREYKVAGLQADITTRIDRRISVKEAKDMLDEATFGKLLKETTSVVLTVRRIKEKEGEGNAA